MMICQPYILGLMIAKKGVFVTEVQVECNNRPTLHHQTKQFAHALRFFSLCQLFMKSFFYIIIQILCTYVDIDLYKLIFW